MKFIAEIKIPDGRTIFTIIEDETIYDALPKATKTLGYLGELMGLTVLTDWLEDESSPDNFWGCTGEFSSTKATDR